MSTTEPIPLVSEPIVKEDTDTHEVYFDSANIAESYSGIVLPLTCSFARMVYEQVYTDLLAMSGISRRKIENNSDIFENLLGFFYGRMYYNMNNWYRMAEFAPGYKRNKKNFELMITSNVRQDVQTTIKPHWLFCIAYPFILAFKVAVFGYVCQRFSSHVKKYLRLLREKELDNVPYEECVSMFSAFNKDLLRQWYITVENDFFVMTYLGLLKKFLGEEELQQSILFPSKATQQVHALSMLSKKMAVIPEVWQSIEREDVNTFYKKLSSHSELEKELNEYVHTFGGRFANELKLESVGIDEDPKKLFSLLKMYKSYELPIPKETHQSTHKKLFVRLILAAFKKHGGRREEFRLLRSNAFAMARRLFKRMGVLLATQGILVHSDDVFYLTLDELLEPTAMSNPSLGTVVEKRKSEYDLYAEVSPPAHFKTKNGTLPLVERASVSKNEKVIQGKPASPGTVTGTVKIFREFSMPEQIDFDILITSHTDPGWTSLIALSKGLIIEHGGVLSHASIVARELGIPAVIGVQDAMRIFRDNQRVCIDGSTGSITVL